MAKPAFTDTEALALAKSCFGLLDAVAVDALPSYDDQNMRIRCEGGSMVVMKFSASRAECRGFADEESTAAQLALEHDAMRLLRSDDAWSVECPVPIAARAPADGALAGVGELGAVTPVPPLPSPQQQQQPMPPALPAPPLYLSSSSSSSSSSSPPPASSASSAASILRVMRPNGGDGVNFVRAISWVAGRPLAEWTQAPAPAVPLPVVLRRLGEVAGRSVRALSRDRTAVGVPFSRQQQEEDEEEEEEEEEEGGGKGAVEGAEEESTAMWDPPAARRELSWDLAKAGAAARYLDDIEDGGDGGGGDDDDERATAVGAGGVVAGPDRALVRRWFRRFEELVVVGEVDGGREAGAEQQPLPMQVIHGDLNDYNVLVRPRSDGGDVAVAVIDFGDMVRTARVFELAITLAYACQNRPSPADALAAGQAVVAGYAAVQALTPREAAVLPTCVAARLCQSLATSAHAIKADPSNAEYNQISAAPGWALLRQWDALDKAGDLSQLTNVIR